MDKKVYDKYLDIWRDATPDKKIAELEKQLLEANAKIERLMGVLVNVKNCPDSDLTTYCMSVDSMVCMALAEIKEGESNE
jgi:hypothetical protein